MMSPKFYTYPAISQLRVELMAAISDKGHKDNLIFFVKINCTARPLERRLLQSTIPFSNKIFCWADSIMTAQEAVPQIIPRNSPVNKSSRRRTIEASQFSHTNTDTSRTTHKREAWESRHAKIYSCRCRSGALLSPAQRIVRQDPLLLLPCCHPKNRLRVFQDTVSTNIFPGLATKEITPSILPLLNKTLGT